jgi:hypothetical protein
VHGIEISPLARTVNGYVDATWMATWTGRGHDPR